MTNEEAIKMLISKMDGNTDTSYEWAETIRMAIKAIETVEEFEKAQIITGGRLNGRTYAYKCGLEDGKRKALEQQSEDCVSRNAVDRLCFRYLQSATDDHIAFYEHFLDLPPVTPKLSTSEDCVSRAEVLKQMKEWRDCEFVKMTNPYHYLEKRIQSMSPVTPTHGTCKDCKHNYKTSRNTFECSNGHRFYMRIPDTFYCADYEKRGSENDI